MLIPQVMKHITFLVIPQVITVFSSNFLAVGFGGFTTSQPRALLAVLTVEFLPIGHSSRSLGDSELLEKVRSTRSHTLETPETTQNPI